MPSSIADLTQKVGIKVDGKVNWGISIQDGRLEPGVYIVAITNDENKIVPVNNPPIDNAAVAKWIKDVPTLKMDGFQPTPADLVSRLERFWLPDETILYIGETTQALPQRICNYYITPLGASGPHSGGCWIKTLSILQNLTVFFSYTSSHTSDNPLDVEKKLLCEFVKCVSSNARKILFDQAHPFPFANLEYSKGCVKKHHIKGATRR